jgi:hypothetical protein
MTNDELQATAEKLAAIRGIESEREQVKTLESQIAEYECGLLKESGGKAYFPLLTRYNGAVPYEEFFDIFTDVLMYLLRNYDPDRISAETEMKASFTTAFGYTLNLRMNDYWRKEYKEREKYNELTVVDPPAPDADPAEQPCTEFELFLRVAPLIALRKNQERHLPKSKKSYFEGFFTFDATAQTKNGLFDEDEIIAENDTLFPLMEFAVLEYLLEGQFESMRDVVENAVKDAKRLERRNETMQICYRLSKPTVVGRNKLYRRLFDAVSA